MGKSLSASERGELLDTSCVERLGQDVEPEADLVNIVSVGCRGEIHADIEKRVQ
jgi:hypothetical protein